MKPDHEVLLLSYERLDQGVLFLREMVFGSDHRVFTRVSWLTEVEDGWRSHGWQEVPMCWESRECLETLAHNMAIKGWKVNWHPREQPGLEEFRREVFFNG